MDPNFDYLYDFSQIDLVELKQLHINRNEVISVFNNPLSQLKAFKGFLFLIGFSERKKITQIAFNTSKNINFELEILQIDLPDERDWAALRIKKYYCA